MKRFTKAHREIDSSRTGENANTRVSEPADWRRIARRVNADTAVELVGAACDPSGTNKGIAVNPLSDALVGNVSRGDAVRALCTVKARSRTGGIARTVAEVRRRSEERRVGKECRARWSTDAYKTRETDA